MYATFFPYVYCLIFDRKDYNFMKRMRFLEHTLAVLSEQPRNFTDVSFIAHAMILIFQNYKFLPFFSDFSIIFFSFH